MITIRPTNLAATLDSTADALFYQQPIPDAIRKDVVTLLISRQVRSGSNSGFFIPFSTESAHPSRLFSGEPLKTGFARRHFQLIEAARVLNLLEMDGSLVTESIQVSEQRMNSMCYSQFCSKGECKTLTVAYMRYLTCSALKDAPSRLSALLSKLVAHHDGKGKWNGFPYFYTLMMLSEADDPLATAELQYAAVLSKRLPASLTATDLISRRRQAILTQAFSRS
jgi:hypothetical protein